jgi:hypothetical protein
MAALDEAVELVEVPQEADQEDLQLRLDNPEPTADLPEETPEDINDREDVEDVEMDIDKDLGTTGPTWKSIYPTPEPSAHFNDISLPVRPEGVKAAMESVFATDADELTPDLPDLPDVEPAVIREIERQHTERFFDYHQYRVPQVWQTAFQAGQYHKRVPPEPKNYRELKGHQFEQEFRREMEKHINEHLNQFKTWTVINHKEAQGHQILGCQWVFMYLFFLRRRYCFCFPKEGQGKGRANGYVIKGDLHHVRTWRTKVVPRNAHNPRPLKTVLMGVTAFIH